MATPGRQDHVISRRVSCNNEKQLRIELPCGSSALILHDTHKSSVCLYWQTLQRMNINTALDIFPFSPSFGVFSHNLSVLPSLTALATFVFDQTSPPKCWSNWFEPRSETAWHCRGPQGCEVAYTALSQIVKRGLWYARQRSLKSLKNIRCDTNRWRLLQRHKN